MSKAKAGFAKIGLGKSSQTGTSLGQDRTERPLPQATGRVLACASSCLSFSNFSSSGPEKSVRKTMVQFSNSLSRGENRSS